MSFHTAATMSGSLTYKDILLSMSTRRFELNVVSEDVMHIYHMLQHKLSEVTADATVVNNVIVQLRKAEIVDYQEVEGFSMQQLVRLFNNKPEKAVAKFLHSLCNIKGFPATSFMFQNVINQEFPGTVIPATKVSSNHLQRFKRVLQPDESYDFRVKRLKDCVDFTSTLPKSHAKLQERNNQMVLQSHHQDYQLPGVFSTSDTQVNQIINPVDTASFKINVESNIMIDEDNISSSRKYQDEQQQNEDFALRVEQRIELLATKTLTIHKDGHFNVSHTTSPKAESAKQTHNFTGYGNMSKFPTAQNSRELHKDISILISSNTIGSFEDVPRFKFRKKGILYASFVIGLLGLSTLSLSAIIFWLIVNDKLFAFNSGGLVQVLARSYDEYKQQMNSLDFDYVSPYNLTINIMNTTNWPFDVMILHPDNLLELHVFGSLSTLALVNLLRQSTNLKKLYIDGSQMSCHKNGFNGNGYDIAKIGNIQASIKLLVLNNLSGECASLIELLHNNIKLDQLEELTFLNSTITERNAFIMQSAIQQSKDTLKVFKFVNSYTDDEFFNIKSFGVLPLVEELVLDTKHATHSLGTVFDCFPNLVKLTLAQQIWELDDLEYFGYTTLKNLEIAVNIPVGQQNVSIAFITQVFPTLKSGTINIKYPLCDINWNYILDTYLVPEHLLVNLKLRSNCRISSH